MQCRHALRRWGILIERVQKRALRLAHIADVLNIIDYATKWVKGDKYNMSVEFLTGAKERREHETSES